MNTPATATGAGFPRRTLLKGAAAVGAGVALSRAEFLPGMAANAQAAENIQDILNITVTTEMFGVTFLGVGLENNRLGRFNAPWSPLEVAIITAARAQEQFHLDFFMGLGGRPLTQTFNVPNPAILVDRRVYFNTLQEQETREVAAQIAAMMTFTALNRPDLVKASFQYAAEEAEHRVLANYSAGARPANNYAFAPRLYGTVAEFLANLRQLGIIGGTGPAVTYPGPGMIDASNVIERTPGGPSVTEAMAPGAPSAAAVTTAPAATIAPTAPPATAAPTAPRATTAPATSTPAATAAPTMGSVPNALPRTGGGAGAFTPRRLGDG